jgi:pyruvate formate lyase activating enzyme
VYTGNVRDTTGGSTVCHACGAVLIEREGYRTRILSLRGDGCCTVCGTRCAGVFDAAPGVAHAWNC